ncbi:MupG family TIM beta-alpha barrel fold protein [Oceanotoga teriensis]|uniref:MupG family TIM beta-alpha barrel fold protein n=1 Tax=Oceanotoga teriensis TaxID=515440 RepID=UPI002712D414|nr:MupG family TIM beta-alpha barrel fold protein [Oceanotoga teriensis]MDO7976502.1 MupG family TIM beta-alpha barrel fold protein [Oceanotoga teriensis]
MLGISVFAGLGISLEENYEYMSKAKELGINKIFTSFHIPESSMDFDYEMNEILNYSKELDMSIIADISKSYFDNIDFNKYNIESLRLDFGFSNKDIAKLTKELFCGITLNASTLEKSDIEEILSFGGDLSKINACHNYYPRPETGISESLFNERNSLFKYYNIELTAFIPSFYRPRGPIFEGLPTLEMHRHMDPVVAYQHLISCGVDNVFFGDSQASFEELCRISDIKKNIFRIPIKIFDVCDEELRILNMVHRNRKDPGEFVVRSSKAINNLKSSIRPNNCIDRFKYGVCIDNHGYLRYEGNLHVLKKDFESDSRVNLVADATEAAILIETIKPGDFFEFEIKRKK